MVRNLTANSSNPNAIVLTWEEPPSLDISEPMEPHSENVTDLDPRTTYVVQIYIINSSGIKSLIRTISNITVSNYTFTLSHPDPNDIFEFVVTAVNPVGRGESSDPIQESFSQGTIIIIHY